MSGNLNIHSESERSNNTSIRTESPRPINRFNVSMMAATNSNGFAPLNNCQQYKETEIWNLKIILEALEEVIFGATTNPKITQEVLLSLQNILINLRTELPKSPWFRNVTKNQRMGSVYQAKESAKLNSTISELDSSLSQWSLSESKAVIPISSMSSESRLVIRTMVSIQIRNLAKDIINVFRPMLKNLNTLEEGSGTEENQIRNALSEITILLEKLKCDDQTLDKEIQDLQKQLQVEMESFSRGIKELEGTLHKLTQLTLAEKQMDKVMSYLDYQNRLNENLRLKQELIELEQDIESNPIELNSEMKSEFEKLESVVARLQIENEEMELKFARYNELGQEYMDLLAEYRSTEEQIKTKEWVKEQLMSNVNDKSLNESFY